MNNEKILGKWHIVKAKMLAPNGEVQDLTQEEIERISYINWTFLSDGTLIVDVQNESGTLSWELENNILVVSTGIEYHIEKLTSKKMILKAELNGYTVIMQFNKIE